MSAVHPFPSAIRADNDDDVIDLRSAFAAKRSQDARSERKGYGPNLAKHLSRAAFLDALRAKRDERDDEPTPPRAA